MTLPIRVQFDDAVYDVTARGNEWRRVDRDDQDRAVSGNGRRGLRTVRATIARKMRQAVEREPDRRVQIWLRVRLGGERMTEVAKVYGYRDRSGIHQVVRRLELRAESDRQLAGKLEKRGLDSRAVPLPLHTTGSWPFRPACSCGRR